MEFFESWLPCILKMTTKAGRIKLKRAHRSVAPKPDQNKAPRSLLLLFHSFKDKQRVMEAARRASQDSRLIYNGSRLSFFSVAVMKKRKAYDTIKQRIQERKTPYAMLFPATLQITHGGSKKRFLTGAGTRLHGLPTRMRGSYC